MWYVKRGDSSPQQQDGTGLRSSFRGPAPRRGTSPAKPGLLQTGAIGTRSGIDSRRRRTSPNRAWWPAQRQSRLISRSTRPSFAHIAASPAAGFSSSRSCWSSGLESARRSGLSTGNRRRVSSSRSFRRASCRGLPCRRARRSRVRRLGRPHHQPASAFVSRPTRRAIER